MSPPNGFGSGLANNATRREKVAILTDSLSLVSRIEAGMVLNEWVDHLTRIPADVTVTYTPGHCGIKFNEKADRLAGNAVLLEHLKMCIRAVKALKAHHCHLVLSGQYSCTYKLRTMYQITDL